MKRKTAATLCLLTSLVLAVGCNKSHDDGRIHASGHIEATEVVLAAKVGGSSARSAAREGDSCRDRRPRRRFRNGRRRTRFGPGPCGGRRRSRPAQLLLEAPDAEDVARAEEMLAKARVELAAARRD